MTTEILVIPNDFNPVDLLLFRRFKREIPGMFERTLELNPGLASLGPFPPRGTEVLVEVPEPAPRGRREPRKLIRLYD